MMTRRDFVKGVGGIAALLCLAPKLLLERIVRVQSGIRTDVDIVMPEYSSLKGIGSGIAALERTTGTFQGRAIYVSPDGSDLNDGLSPETGKRTLSAAIQALPHGSRARSAVYVSGYVHDEAVTIPANAIIYLTDHTRMERCTIMRDANA